MLFTKIERLKAKLFWNFWSNAPKSCFEPNFKRNIAILTLLEIVVLFGFVLFLISIIPLTPARAVMFLFLGFTAIILYSILSVMYKKKIESILDEKLSEKLKSDFLNELIDESDFRKFYPQIRKKEKEGEREGEKKHASFATRQQELDTLISEFKEMDKGENK